MKRKSSLIAVTAFAFTLIFVFCVLPPSFAGGDSWHHAWSHGPSGVAPFTAAPPGPIVGEGINGYTPNPWHSDGFQPASTDACSGPGPCWAQQAQSTGFQPWPMAHGPNASSNQPLAGYDPDQTNEALQTFLEDARQRFTGPSGSPGLTSRIVPTTSSSIPGGGGGG